MSKHDLQEMTPLERPKKKSGWLLLAGVTTILMLVGAINSASRSSEEGTSGTGSSSQSSSTVSVLYEVEGTATAANLTLESGTGTVQQNDKAVPLRTTSGKGLKATMLRGDFAYISVQNQGAIGTVTCRITVDGVVISTNTSSGAYAIVSCSGSAG